MDKKATVLTFEVKDEEGKTVTLRVQKPTPAQLHKSQCEYNAVFRELVSGPKRAILREALDDVMRQDGLWSDEKEKEYQSIVKEMNETELKLVSGGIKLSEGYDLALKMRMLRRKRNQLTARRQALDNLTAQGQADDHAFDYLVSQCTLYDDTGKPYFKNFEDYKERSMEDVAILASQKLMLLQYGVDNDFERHLPENKFLTRFKYVDDKLRLVNKEGKLVDEKGRLVNEQYQLVDAEGNLIDEEGNRITETGEYVVEPAPFIDDETGEPIQDS